VSSSQQEITLKNTAIESSMKMDSWGSDKSTSCTEIPFILFPVQKEPFLFRHIFGLLKHHLLTLAHVEPTFHVCIPQ
jgi:hypothetical protein